MNTPDLQFNKDIINKIKNFYNSNDELLLLSGFSGCAKTEVLNLSLEEIKDTTLVFIAQCFDECSIDDFLLNFYDSFRNFALQKKVALKKSLGDSFAQKVSFYFKNSDKNSIIVVDNYELVSNNQEILNFLSHIAKFENAKVVLVSRNKEISFFEKQNIKIQKIEIHPHTKEIFKQKLESDGQFLNDENLEEFYNLTQGYELYLKMALRYSKITGVKIEDLLFEFGKKKINFFDFIISKVISLVPTIYYPILQNLSALNHVVSIDFIEHHHLGEVKQIEYLKRNLLVSEINGKIALKSYFKEYFISTLSIQEKFKIFKDFISIFEDELAKSPRDRYLRLSRESIRKQIEILDKNTPKLSKTVKVEQKNFSYMSLAQEGLNPWIEALGDKKSSIFKKREPAIKKKSEVVRQNTLSDEDKAILKQYRKQKFEQEQSKQLKQWQIDFNSAFKMALGHEDEYQYSKANEIFAKLLEQAQNEATRIDILEHLAKNCEKLKEFENVLEYYSQIAAHYFAKQNWHSYYDAILKSGQLYQNLYRFNSARDEYLKIINSFVEIDNLTKALACLGLGDILESENYLDKALGFYHQAQDLIKGEDVKLEAEISFKTALIYDDMQNFDKAIEFYIKNIETTKNTSQNKWLSQSYTNCGLIYAYQNDSKNAIKYLKLAIETDESEDNLQAIYFNCREIAKICRESDPQNAFTYIKKALTCAKKMNDGFKIAFAYLEAGDLFYDTKQNEQALECYFRARNNLGNDISKENEEIIIQRINDMKIKIIEAKYAKL